MIMSRSREALRSVPLGLLLVLAAHLRGATVTGEIVDSRTGRLIPARLYIEADDDRWFFAELDKHDWPWSMTLVPVMGVDLYELANNHPWRTEFGFSKWNSAAGNFTGLPGDGWSGTERDWIEYSCRNYYTLLDCGFRLRPSAGTANGVHPVPLGFGRVYVECPRGFSYGAWLRGLNEGRSFATTGPMLFAELDGRPPGARVTLKPGKVRRVEVAGVVISDEPVTAIEIIINGDVAHRLLPGPRMNRDKDHEAKFQQVVELTGSSWIAVRCWEPRAGGRIQFAHTAPWFFDVPDAPLQPRRDEIDFLIGRGREQIGRSSGVLHAEEMAEYRKALAIYEEIARHAVRRLVCSENWLAPEPVGVIPVN
jgi:hypothetical protein